MPICIECRYPINQLYTTHSKADDRSLGKGVRLTQCPQCRQFADKYVEHDFVIIFIDLVLIKPQVYRHLLFNRLADYSGASGRQIIRLGVLLLLFDVYLTWTRVERSSLGTSGLGNGSGACQNGLITIAPVNSTPFSSPSPGPFQLTSPSKPTQSVVAISPFAALPSFPLFAQYLFFLGLCMISQLSFHFPIRFLYLHPPGFLVKLGLLSQPKPVFRPGNEPVAPTPAASTAPPVGSPPLFDQDKTEMTTHSQSHSPHPRLSSFSPTSSSILSFASTAPISTSILVSSGTKLFPLLLLIWNYDFPSSATALNCAVTINNIAALKILLDGEDSDAHLDDLLISCSVNKDKGRNGGDKMSLSPSYPLQRIRSRLKRRRRESTKSLVSAILFVAVGAFVRVLVMAAVLTGIGIFLGRTWESSTSSEGGYLGLQSASRASLPVYSLHGLFKPSLSLQLDDPCIIHPRGVAKSLKTALRTGHFARVEETGGERAVTGLVDPTAFSDTENVASMLTGPGADSVTITTTPPQLGASSKEGQAYSHVSPPYSSGFVRPYAFLDPWTIWQLSWRCGLGFVLT